MWLLPILAGIRDSIRFDLISHPNNHHLIRIVADHRQRADPLPVEPEVLGKRLCERNAVPVSHESPDRPRILFCVPRSEALNHRLVKQQMPRVEI